MVDPSRQSDHPEFESSDFEHDLRQALQPRSAPPGFAARLMQQLPPEAQSIEFSRVRVPHTSLPLACVGGNESPSAPNPRRTHIFSFPPAVRLAAVASVLIVVLIGNFAWQQHQQRIAGERARQQVIMALQITHATLQQVADNVSSIQNRKDLQP